MLNFRFRPTAYTKEIKVPELGVEAFYQETPVPTAIFYSGKRNNHDFHFRYRNVEEMIKRIEERIALLKARAADKAEYNEKLKSLNATFEAKNHFKVGDVVVNSWGYEQTNIEFYQVIEVLPKSIRVKEIMQKTDESRDGGCSMSCYVLPSKDSFIEKEQPFVLKLKLDTKGNCNICDPKSYYSFRKWGGGSQYKSWYA